MPAAGRGRPRSGVLARSSRVGSESPDGDESGVGWGWGWVGLCLEACLLASAAACWLSLELRGSCEVPGSKTGCFSHSSLSLKNYSYLLLCVCRSSEGGWWESVPSFQRVGTGDRNSLGWQQVPYPLSHLAGLRIFKHKYLSGQNICFTASPPGIVPSVVLSSRIDRPGVSGRSAPQGIGLCFDYRHLLRPKTVMYPVGA